MPYQVRGRDVYHKVGGKWKRKARARSKSSAKRMVRLLHAKGYGGRGG